MKSALSFKSREHYLLLDRDIYNLYCINSRLLECPDILAMFITGATPLLLTIMYRQSYQIFFILYFKKTQAPLLRKGSSPLLLMIEFNY